MIGLCSAFHDFEGLPPRQRSYKSIFQTVRVCYFFASRFAPRCAVLVSLARPIGFVAMVILPQARNRSTYPMALLHKSRSNVSKVRPPSRPRQLAPNAPPFAVVAGPRRAGICGCDVLRATASAPRRRLAAPGDTRRRAPGAQRPLGGGGAVQRAQEGALRFRDQRRGPAGHARASGLPAGGCCSMVRVSRKGAGRCW